MPTEGLLRSFDATIEDINPTRKSIVARINTSSRDRYNTVILAKGCKHKNWRAAGGPVLWEHARHDFKDIMANADRLWNNGGPNPTEIIAEPIFTDHPFAQERFAMYESGKIRGWSVNCIPTPGTYGPPTQQELRSHPEWEGVDTVFRDWELVEFSGTIVPGNAEALTSSHAAKIMSMVERGLLWMPPEAEPIYRSALTHTRTVVMPGMPPVMTDSLGGLEGGGAAVKPAVKGDDDGAPHDPMCPPGAGCERCDAARMEAKGGPRSVAREIVEEGGKSFVLSGDGSKRLGGPYASKGEAEKRLEQVEDSGHEGAEEKRANPGKPPVEARADGDGDEDEDEDETPAGSRSAPGPSADPVAFDGRGGWTVRGIDGVSFEARDVAERAAALMKAPPRFAAEWDAIRAEFRSRDEEATRRILDEIDLRVNGRV